MEKRGHDMYYEELYQDLQQYEKTLKYFPSEAF